VGSVLVGDKTDIKRARRIRKVLGGGMRQAGYLAAACLYALDHHIEDLKIDNDRARHIGAILSDRSYVSHVRPVMTNIVIFSLADKGDPTVFLHKLDQEGILAVQFGPHEIRLVFHRDLTQEDITHLEKVLLNLK